MTLRLILMLTTVVLLENAYAEPVNAPDRSDKTASQPLNEEKDDLKTAASGYPDRYSDWARGYSSGYGVTGYGSLDDRYAGYGGYDNSYGYGGYDGDSSRYGSGGYGGYRGGYGGTSGYGGSGGYGSNSGYGGYGGYGGYSGNGGLNSYYGYNNPNYQGGNHLGYGYYKRPGYGNIYNSGITPSLVTGYRGYSRK